MTAQRAFVGQLQDITFRWVEGLMVAHVVLPTAEFDAFTRGAGMLGDNLAILACGTPQHPARDVDVLAAALAERLTELLRATKPGEGPTLSPELLDRLGRLGAVVGARVCGELARDITQPRGNAWPTTW